jgi:predicted nuclease of predicted toxin-antitoxin system
LTGILLDEMYPPALAQRLRDSGHDVLAVLDVEVGLASISDDDVLAWAARNNRCVVTENVSDFARLAALGVQHAGIVFVSAQRFPRTAKGLVRLGHALEAVLAAKQLPPQGGLTELILVAYCGDHQHSATTKGYWQDLPVGASRACRGGGVRATLRSVLNGG